MLCNFVLIHTFLCTLCGHTMLPSKSFGNMKTMVNIGKTKREISWNNHGELREREKYTLGIL